MSLRAAGEVVLLDDLGTVLRQTREAKGISLAQAEDETKIRIKYLNALEQGLDDQIPGEVYLKGFLRTYGNYLGLDGTALVEQYKRQRTSAAAEDGEQPAAHPDAGAAAPAISGASAPSYMGPDRPPPVVRKPIATVGRSGPRIWLPLVVMLAVGGSLAALMLLRSPGQSGGPDPAPPPQTPVNSVPDTPPEPDPTEPEPEPPDPSQPQISLGPMVEGERVVTVTPGPLELTLTAAPDWSWIRVIADGQMVHEGNLSPGEPRTFRAEQELFVRVGYTEVVTFTVNGQELGQVATEEARSVYIRTGS